MFLKYNSDLNKCPEDVPPTKETVNIWSVNSLYAVRESHEPEAADGEQERGLHHRNYVCVTAVCCGVRNNLTPWGGATSASILSYLYCTFSFFILCL